MLDIPKHFIAKDPDLDESLKLLKRQQYEDERKKRIFNTKSRRIGVDLEALERQIVEKNKARQFEEEYNRRYAEAERVYQLTSHAKELENQRRRRMLQQDINFYRQVCQKKEQRREFDLNDPDSMRKSEPARIADDDVRLGISSAQIFSGEDLYNRDRARIQKQQQREWLDQQIREKKEAKQSMRMAERLLEANVVANGKRIEEMKKSETVVRSHMFDSVHEYNREMARQKAAERERAKREKNEDDLAEIYNMLTSDMLTENPDVAQSSTNPKKKIAFMYRGMTPEELQVFREGQMQQRRDNERKRGEEKIYNTKWDHHALRVDHELVRAQQFIESRQRQATRNCRDYNEILAHNKRGEQYRQMQNEKEGISDEFYRQFNKTSR